MKKIILFSIIVLGAMITKLNAQNKGSYKHVLDWSYWQPESANYEMNSEKSTAFSNQDILTIKSVKSEISSFGTLMKTMKPNPYLGKTLKMSVSVKNKNVKSWAGLWMRVDYYSTNVLAFDNMEGRPIKGTKDWTKYEIVLFVPAETTSISYGVLLAGTGEIWFKDVNLEVVDDTVPETGPNKGREHKVISFEKRAKSIASEIKAVNDYEKNLLKTDINALDKEVEQGIISKEKADELKLEKAKQHAANIDAKVSIEESKLNQLIQDKVDGKFEDEVIQKERTKVVLGINNDSIHKYGREFNLTSTKFYNGKEDKEIRQSKRTTSQIIFAAGLNNLVTDKSIQNSDFKYLGSRFYEWGLTYNTRIFKNDNLLHAKYGLSVMYNDLKATNNSSFVVDGNQTYLEENTIKQDNSRFRNVNLVFPIHLEFDFTKPTVRDGKTYFKTHDSFRLGLGGYIGTNLKSKQIIKYDVDGYDSVEKTKGDFNTNDFIYGLSTYIGYKATSLYLKYDLNPLFKDNVVKQNNVSLGLRFDFN